MNTINELVSYLKKCDEAYYGSGQVLVSNDTYDSMVETLKRMDPTNPYLNKVGAEPNGTNKVGRIVPMGTLDKLHENHEVQDWLSSEDGMIILAPKYDGFGVELTYVEGKLVMASTRGDGTTGEDVTEAIQYVENVPKILPECFGNLTCVRGECIIPREHHDDVKSLGYTAMRNAVPGIVRSCRVDALKYVNFVAYEFFDGVDDRHYQRSGYSNLFEVEDYWVHEPGNFTAILADRDSLGKNKDLFKYEIDGTVLKTVLIKEDDLRHPKHQVAWKFKSNRRETILRGIEVSVGVTGNISVVGLFDPVEFQGAKLTRASFGSLQRYNSLKPAIGCTVSVSRRGDIIPMIEEVVDYGDEEFKSIDTCPCCGEPLINYSCANKECPDKIKLRVLNYIGTLRVKGIGNSLVTRLVEGGHLRTVSDIYKLDAGIISTLPRQGQSSVDKWRTLQTKEITLVEFLTAYPFDNIGEVAWKSLLDSCSILDLLNMTYNEFMNLRIKGLGSSKLESIFNQLNSSKEEIQELLELLKLV